MSVGGGGDDLSGLAADIAEALEELSGVDRVDEWTIRTMVVTMVPLLLALSILQMVSGTVLETFEEVLLQTPSLLILVPVQIGTAGNLGSILCSRLSTQLHLGTFEIRFSNPNVQANIGAILGLGATVFVLVGIAAWGIGRMLGGRLTLFEVLTVSVVSGLLLTVFVIAISLVSVYLSYRMGFNPDDTTIPVVTNISDITGVLILFAVVSVTLL